MKEVIITAPSLDPSQNVSGVSSVVQFIIDNNKECHYTHFQLGKTDLDNSRLKSIWTNLKALSKWKSLLKKNPQAIIHYSFPLSAPSIIRDPFFMRYALKKGRKMVVHVHGGLFLTHKAPWYLRPILKCVCGWDVPFIVLSEGEKEILEKKFGARNVSVLANCPDLSDAHGFERGQKPIEKPLVFGYMGRIEPKKGMTELVCACLSLSKEKIPYRLHIAGKERIEGEFLPAFDRWCGSRLTYAGVVSGDKKSEFLRGLDVFVMPTYFEGLPMALLESMAYGVVPVVTPVGSIPSVVKDGVNGIFIKDHDHDSIVQAVKKLSADRTLVERLGKDARKTIFDNFSSEKYVEKLNRIYDNIQR